MSLSPLPPDSPHPPHSPLQPTQDLDGHAGARRVLVLATSNPHKLEEMVPLFASAQVECILLSTAAKERGVSLIEPQETGDTFERNATIKALSYAQQLSLPCLADDSGLEIDALAGRPGVISSHYCTDGRETGLARAERDSANNARVLKELEGIAFEKRSARFVCVMCLAVPGRADPLALVRGTFEGRIGLPPRVPAGANGFGYDPLFLVAPGFDRSGAELSPEEKNRLSHRAKAASLMLPRLSECFSTRTISP